MTFARGLFRTSVLLYAAVVLAATRDLPVRAPVTGGADAWAARSQTFVLLVGGGLAAALLVSAAGCVLRVLPLRYVRAPAGTRRRLRSAVAEDVYVVGVVTMLLLTGLALDVAGDATPAPPGSRGWGSAMTVLTVVCLAALAVARSRSRAAAGRRARA